MNHIKKFNEDVYGPMEDEPNVIDTIDAKYLNFLTSFVRNLSMMKDSIDKGYCDKFDKNYLEELYQLHNSD